MRESRLDEIAHIVDCEHKTAPKDVNGKFYSIRTTDILNGKIDFDKANRVSHATYIEWSKRAAPRFGDIILAREAPVGEVGFIRDGYHVCLGQRTVLISVRSGDVDNRFLLYYLASPNVKYDLRSRSTGSVVQHLNIKDIRAFQVLLPSLQEQKAIASVLSSLDDKIDLLHRQNKTLEAIAETLFRQWFVEGKSTMVYRFEELVESVSNKHEFDKDEVIFLNTSDIYDGKFLNHEYSEVHGLPGQAKKSIQKDDILFTEIRPANRRFAFIDFDSEDYVVSTKLMVLRSKGVLDTSIIFLFLKQQETLDYLQMLAEGRSGTFPQITFDHLKTVEIFIPQNKQLLADIQTIFHNIVKKTFRNHSSINILVRLRDVLLPQLMSGKVKISLD